MTTTEPALSPADALRRIAARVPEHSAPAEWAREAHAKALEIARRALWIDR